MTRIFALSVALLLSNLCFAAEPGQRIQLAKEMVKDAFEGNVQDFQDKLQAATESSPEITKKIFEILVSPKYNLELADLLPEYPNVRYNPLHAAAVMGNIDIIKSIVELPGLIDVNAFSQNPARTALIWAVEAKKNPEEAVKTLLSAQNINVNEDDEDGYTALMHSIKLNKPTVTKLILDYLEKYPKKLEEGINIIGKDNKTALDLADKTFGRGHPIVQRMINEGAKNAVDAQPAVLNIPELQKSINTLTQKLDALMQQLPK